jgi:hypothetical protein
MKMMLFTFIMVMVKEGLPNFPIQMDLDLVNEMLIQIQNY